MSEALCSLSEMLTMVSHYDSLIGRMVGKQSPVVFLVPRRSVSTQVVEASGRSHAKVSQTMLSRYVLRGSCALIASPVARRPTRGHPARTITTACRTRRSMRVATESLRGI